MNRGIKKRNLWVYIPLTAVGCVLIALIWQTWFPLLFGALMILGTIFVVDRE